MRAYVAEFVGTALFVIAGCSAAVFAGNSIGIVGSSLAFGLSLMVVTYAFDKVSGAHVNPAVTLALVLTGKFNKAKLIPYWIAQFSGAILGGAILLIMSHSAIANLGFAANGLVNGTSFDAAFLSEMVFTMILCLIAVEVAANRLVAGFHGIVLGSALMLAHLSGTMLTNGSFNPAQSAGIAMFVGGQALSQLWLFILAPLVGAGLAWLIHAFLQHPTHIEKI